MERQQQIAALAASVAARNAVDVAIAQQVRECRRAGITWDEIAEITGVSKPTAINRWKDTDITMTTITTTTPPDWNMQPGETIRRRALHDIFGGNRQSGISTPRTGTEIMLYTGNGKSFGYEDRFLPDGRFLYNGEGLSRNQEMTRGNRAIMRQAEDGKHLRVLKVLSKGVVEYVGEFAYQSHEAVRRMTPTGLYEHIVFTLVPA